MVDLCQDTGKQSFFYLAGVLMEHFLKGIAPLRHWYINSLLLSYFLDKEHAIVDMIGTYLLLMA